jgi:hypothetical protein
VSALVLNGVQVPATDAMRVRTFVQDASLAFAGSKRGKVVSEIVVHETVTRDVETTLRVLRRRKLGAHFIVVPDGELLQLADPIRTRLEHAAPHNVRSIGIEIVNPVEPRFLRPRLPWTRTLKASWAAGGHYVLPTPEQAEACAALIEFVTRERIQGLAVPRVFRGEKNGRLAMGRVAGAKKPQPGIYAHSYFHHQDGAWPVLYAWLRLEGGLAPADAFEKAAELASGNVRSVNVGALRKVSGTGRDAWISN